MIELTLTQLNAFFRNKISFTTNRILSKTFIRVPSQSEVFWFFTNDMYSVRIPCFVTFGYTDFFNFYHNITPKQTLNSFWLVGSNSSPPVRTSDKKSDSVSQKDLICVKEEFQKWNSPNSLQELSLTTILNPIQTGGSKRGSTRWRLGETKDG